MSACLKPKTIRRKSNSASLGYEPRWISVATVLRTLGAANEEIAEAFGLTLAELNRCRKENPDFSAAWNVESALDVQVEQALFRRAIGYTCERSKIFVRRGVPVTVVYEQHIPPDPRAAEFWLINQRSDRWQRIPEHRRDMSDGPLASLAKALENTGFKPRDYPVQASPQGETSLAPLGEEE